MAERDLCVVRGGGDLATGVVWRLAAAGVAVLVTELAAPRAVRRTVALSSAVTEGSVMVEGMVGRLVSSVDEALAMLDGVGAGPGPPFEVPVIVSEELPDIGAAVVVDARMAKRNIDTSMSDAALVVGLGPGFTAEVDCRAVVETMRGPRLGRVLWSGRAEPDTGTPGTVGGKSADRVLRAPGSGEVTWRVAIGDVAEETAVLGHVGGTGGESGPVVAPFRGLVRGLIAPGSSVSDGQKIGDLDPRLDVAVDEISDKALAIGGGVVEAVLTWKQGRR